MNTTTWVVIGALALVAVGAYVVYDAKQKSDAAVAAAEAERRQAAAGELSEERRILGGIETAVGGAFTIVDGIFDAVGV